MDKFIYKDFLMTEILPLVKEIQKLKKHTEEFGLFTADNTQLYIYTPVLQETSVC